MPKLKPVEINKKIQSKFCKVITEYGEATGFFVDDEKGILLSSFHLLGAVKTIRYPIQTDFDLKVACILLLNGYMDGNGFHLTPEALKVGSKEQIKLLIHREEKIAFNLKGNDFLISVSLEELQAIRSDATLLNGVLQIFTSKKIGDVYPGQTVQDLKVMCLLRLKGYLDENFCLAQPTSDIQSMEQLLDQVFNFNLKATFTIGNVKNDVEVNLENFLQIKNNMEILEKIIAACQNTNATNILNIFSIENGAKIICILLSFGYLDNQFCFTELARKTTSKEQLIQNLRYFMKMPAYDFRGLTITVNPQDAQQISEDAVLVDKILDIFNRGRYERDVSILSETVEILYDNQRLFGRIHVPAGKNGLLLKNNYAFFDTVPIQVTHFEDGTPFLEGNKLICTGETIESLPQEADPLEIGERVYFGGYPLTRQEYTFSTGMISAINSDMTQKQVAVIEAPIAPGNSGGMVFVQREDKVYWIGVISSEVARISKRILELREYLAVHPEVFSVGTHKGSLGFIEMFREMMAAVLDNLSTGKGNVILLQSLDQLYDEAFAKQVDMLFDQFLDFFVPKKESLVEKKKLKLFEFINGQGITRLTKKDLVNYINQNADLDTRRGIYAQINQMAIEGYIDFPKQQLFEDQKINAIHSDRVVSEEPEYLRELYKFAFLVSEGSLKNNQFQFTDESILVDATRFVTRKFFTDHIAGQNKQHQKQKADEVQERRGIAVSTTIRETELVDISEEVKRSQEFYKIAETEAREIASGQNRSLKSVFFQTTKVFTLECRYRNQRSQRVTSPFFYSVAKKEGAYYMHHFESMQVKPTWEQQPLTIEQDGQRRSVYYKFA